MATVDFLFTDVKCKQCELLQETLRYEREQKEYLQKLLLQPKLAKANEVDLDDWPGINKIITLTHMRKEAEKNSRLAMEHELMDAERMFERELENAKNEEGS